MRKINITSNFGAIGGILWGVTILLRESMLVNNNIASFILGIMPNIAAAWLFIWVGQIVYERINKEFTFKESIKVSSLIFLFALISEVIHDMFLNSPFDIYDIISTLLAIAFYLIVCFMCKANKKGGQECA